MDHEKIIYLAGGCFWGLEEYLSRVTGVKDTEVGYANSIRENPSYEEVCSGETKAAETVRVVYDTKTISLDRLLKAYFQVVDPTSVNRQGNDRGIQYRTGIYYVDEADIPVVSQALECEKGGYDKPLATEVMPLVNFYPAEEYHQDYLKKNPGGYCHINVARADQFNHENEKG